MQKNGLTRVELGSQSTQDKPTLEIVSSTMISNSNYICISLWSRYNFAERVLNIFLMKIIATIFDFYPSEILGRERNLF